MWDKVYIRQYSTSLNIKAAQRYDIPPEKCHVGHLLLQGLLDKPSSINQIDTATDESESNLSVATRSCRVASAMQKYGLQPNDTVIIMGPNHLDLAIPFYACHYNGYSVCGIDMDCQPEDLQLLFPFIKPKLVFCQKACEEKMVKAFKSCNFEGKLIFFDDKDNNMEAFVREHNGTDIDFRPTEFDHSETIAWLLLTSGTTGLPKVVTVPYHIVVNAVCCWFEQFTHNVEKMFAMATLQWVSAYILLVAGPLRRFTRVQSSSPFTPQNLIAIINKYKPNGTNWTPYLLGQFIVAAENGHCDLSSFKTIGIAGSVIEKDLLDRFRKICPAFLYLIYSMSELLVPIFDFDEDTPDKSVGQPKDRYKYKLIDNDGHIVNEPFKEGELWVKGDAFFTCYLNNPEETKKMVSEDGWIMTGDIFQRDEQNYYYFVDRKRLLMRYKGFFISPVQIEEVIRRHPGVKEACVVSIPNADTMELPIAAIQRHNDKAVEPKDIFDLLKNNLPENKQVHGGIFFVDSFPITASGKLNRTKVRELALTTRRIMPK